MVLGWLRVPGLEFGVQQIGGRIESPDSRERNDAKSFQVRVGGLIALWGGAFFLARYLLETPETAFILIVGFTLFLSVMTLNLVLSKQAKGIETNFWLALVFLLYGGFMQALGPQPEAGPWALVPSVVFVGALYGIFEFFFRREKTLLFRQRSP